MYPLLVKIEGKDENGEIIMRILLANLTKMVNDIGGIAKVTAIFANEMQRRGRTVSLVYSVYVWGISTILLIQELMPMTFVITRERIFPCRFGIK